MVVITQKTQRSNSSTSTRLFWLREGQLHPNLLYNQLLRPRLTIPSISVFACRFGTERYTELISSVIISFNCIIPANNYAKGSIRGTHATYQSLLRSISLTRNHYLVHVHVDDHILTIPANRQACKSQSHACNQCANSSLDLYIPQWHPHPQRIILVKRLRRPSSSHSCDQENASQNDRRIKLGKNSLGSYTTVVKLS